MLTIFLMIWIPIHSMYVSILLIVLLNSKEYLLSDILANFLFLPQIATNKNTSQIEVFYRIKHFFFIISLF